ncbi:unnamed protein product [Dibothriocephalus latus]|uniref:PARG catalytic Macro domain-containing protein n=1 Tax=Dibothriocephalus latus TaxID=60516 RepID=A0A3P7LG63_DIBLA|nr:unnamed protein product [Dibothriocephalus latus]
MVDSIRARAGAAAEQLIHEQHRSKVQKVICILHYFSRVLAEDGAPAGAITFARRCLNHPPDFESSTVLIGSVPLSTSSTSLIEDAGSDCLQASYQLNETDNHVKPGFFLLLTSLGSPTFRDKQGRWKKVVTMIDAVCFADPVLQFQTEFLRRELRKAYAGFTDIAAPYRSLPAIVVSGHWGCGAFRGNKALKALLQLMACAQACKALAYSTFGEEHFGEEILRMYDSLADSQSALVYTHPFGAPEVQKNVEMSEYVFKAVQQQLTSKETRAANESTPA